MSTKSAHIDPLPNAPRFLKETLNGPPDECDPELKWLVTQWLKVKGDRPRFLGALMKAGRSARPFTAYEVYWSVTAPADSPGIPYPIKGSTVAEGYFLQFMLHPDQWQFAGPCPRKGCGKYFLKTTRHYQRFCRRNKCGKAASVSDYRDRERKRKMDEINEAIEAWQRAKTKEDWRSYVTQRAGVSKKLLTCWVKDGSLTDPQKGRRG